LPRVRKAAENSPSWDPAGLPPALFGGRADVRGPKEAAEQITFS
jgi:hypothetical protein